MRSHSTRREGLPTLLAVACVLLIATLPARAEEAARPLVAVHFEVDPDFWFSSLRTSQPEAIQDVKAACAKEAARILGNNRRFLQWLAAGDIPESATPVAHLYLGLRRDDHVFRIPTTGAPDFIPGPAPSTALWGNDYRLALKGKIGTDVFRLPQLSKPKLYARGTDMPSGDVARFEAEVREMIQERVGGDDYIAKLHSEFPSKIPLVKQMRFDEPNDAIVVPIDRARFFTGEDSVLRAKFEFQKPGEDKQSGAAELRVAGDPPTEPPFHTICGIESVEVGVNEFKDRAVIRDKLRAMAGIWLEVRIFMKSYLDDNREPDTIDGFDLAPPPEEDGD